jgi:DNA gyrase subunit A
MGRTARGVRGIKIGAEHRVNAMLIADSGSESTILTATEKGYGKRTKLDDYSLQGRGGMGSISIQVTERNGNAVGALIVDDADEAMLITNGGTLVRTKMNEISVIGRNTQGVRLINVSGEERLISVGKVVESSDEDDLDAESEASLPPEGNEEK